MSIPASLLPSARSAYRSVFRAARITFQGDIPRRAALENAVRETFKSPTMTPPSASSPAPTAVSSSSSPSSASSSSTSSSGWKSSELSTPSDPNVERTASASDNLPDRTSAGSPSSTSGEGVSAAVISPELLAQRISEWKEVAQFLRRNVVQGEEVESGAYRLRLTPDTELNDNLHNQPSPEPLTPFPNRDKANRRKCGETPPEAPAFW